MALFEVTLILLLGAVLLTGFARRIGVPYPSLLALAGAAVAFLPFAPKMEIDPQLALALFIAPVLLDAAFDTSPRDLKRYALSLTLLAVVAVILTTAAVAWVGWSFAGLPITAAIALGAIVAPSDAAAAAAVLGQFRPPRRILAVLQGESLLNDATALLIYRMAVAAAVGTLALKSDAPLAVALAFGSVVAGYLLGRLYVLLTAPVHDAPSNTVLQFVGTFGVWLLAERVGLSAIITMVAYAMTLAQIGPRRMPARNRVSAYSVWETAVFVLNVLAFALMGLQARPILDRLTAESRSEALLLAAAVLATVIAVRFVWVLLCGWIARKWKSSHPRQIGGKPPELRGDVLVGWCGMRGLVTLATAFALPADFPGRDPIVLTAFCVVLGTLVIQGMTLEPLMRLLNFGADRSVEEDVSRARVAILQAAIDSLPATEAGAAASMREQYSAALIVAKDSENPQGATAYDELRLNAIRHQRLLLQKLRAEGTIGDEAYHRLEEEIDWAELDAAPAGYFQSLTT
jgi:CPA1 family monovalent cation:H+ antiporter